MSTYNIEVRFINFHGGVYTCYMQEMWKQEDSYIFNNPSHTFGNPRNIKEKDIIHIKIGEDKLLFYQGKPCVV